MICGIIKVEVSVIDNTYRDLDNSAHITKIEFNSCFIIRRLEGSFIEARKEFEQNLLIIDIVFTVSTYLYL